MLTAAAAKELFLKSNLPSRKLRRIWKLVDEHKLGRLSRMQFVVAMHLINKVKTHTMDVPSSLPVFLRQLIPETTANTSMSPEIEQESMFATGNLSYNERARSLGDTIEGYIENDQAEC